MIFGNIVAPYWFLYQFFPHIVSSNNFIQQLIICLAISIPVSLLGYISELWYADRKGEIILVDRNSTSQDNELAFKYLSEGSINTALMFYTPCLLAFFAHLEERNAIIGCIFAFLGITTSIIRRGLTVKKKK